MSTQTCRFQPNFAASFTVLVTPERLQRMGVSPRYESCRTGSVDSRVSFFTGQKGMSSSVGAALRTGKGTLGST